VAGVTVVTTVNARHLVTGVRVGRLMIVVAHIVHLKPISAGAFEKSVFFNIAQGRGQDQAHSQALVQSNPLTSERISAADHSCERRSKSDYDC
jgi:hypothetical protein